MANGCSFNPTEHLFIEETSKIRCCQGFISKPLTKHLPTVNYFTRQMHSLLHDVSFPKEKLQTVHFVMILLRTPVAGWASMKISSVQVLSSSKNTISYCGITW